MYLVTGHDLVHVEDSGGVVHTAAVRDGNHREGVLATGCRERGAVDRIDRDVAGLPLPRAHVLAVIEHRGVILFALADDDQPVEVDGTEELAHGIHRSAVGGVLVAAPDERNGSDGRGLGCPNQLHSEVAIGMLEGGSGISVHLSRLPSTDD